jgi:hypothetical protein
MYVSMTGLRPASALQLPRFWWHSLRSMAQARRAPGNLEATAKKVGPYYHTMTVWTDRASMRAFLAVGAHLQAMKSFRAIGNGKTWGFDSEAMPDWDAAYDLWLRHAREI